MVPVCNTRSHHTGAGRSTRSERLLGPGADGRRRASCSTSSSCAAWRAARRRAPPPGGGDLRPRGREVQPRLAASSSASSCSKSSGFRCSNGPRSRELYRPAPEILEELAARGYPIAERILRHRELAKLQSTYVEALPGMVAADGRIHTRFNQAVAATAGFSSANPNLQNIPIRTEIGQRIRRAFVAPRATGW